MLLFFRAQHRKLRKTTLGDAFNPQHQMGRMTPQRGRENNIMSHESHAPAFPQGVEWVGGFSAVMRRLQGANEMYSNNNNNNKKINESSKAQPVSASVNVSVAWADVCKSLLRLLLTQAIDFLRRVTSFFFPTPTRQHQLNVAQCKRMRQRESGSGSGSARD